MAAQRQVSRSTPSTPHGDNRLARLIIAVVVVVLALWFAIAVLVAGVRYALDPETDVRVGGPQGAAIEMEIPDAGLDAGWSSWTGPGRFAA